jgi:hypothetical protein
VTLGIIGYGAWEFGLKNIRKKKKKSPPLTGLNAVLRNPFLLEDGFIKRSVFAASGGEEEDGEAEDFVSLFQRLRREYAHKKDMLKIVILGRPGSGKTTLLKWIDKQCAPGDNGKPFAGLIPVLYPLHILAQHLVKNKLMQSDILYDIVTAKHFHPQYSASVMKKAFEAHRLLFLFDGLDEVADESVRRDMIYWLMRQKIGKNTMLITSGFSGLPKEKGLSFHDSFPLFHLRDFDSRDIEAFLKNRFRYVRERLTGGVTTGESIKAFEPGKLAVNPLLLTLIAVINRNRGRLRGPRHSLYEKCLTLVPKQWNDIHEGVSFEVETVIRHMASLAAAMMKENRQIIGLAKIKELWPDRIDNKPVDFFLKELVLKYGLLYYVEGKCLFPHRTFLEYLTARYFARSENQNDILEYRDMSYWAETFRFFVPIADARLFFDEVIENLSEKEYWRQAPLWNDCLEEIEDPELRQTIELQFARRVLDVLHEVEYIKHKEESQELICGLKGHNSLYKCAPQLEDRAWRLFEEAMHPYVQSIAVTILSRAGDTHQAKLAAKLKERVEAYERQEDRSSEQQLKFLYRNQNTFLFLMATRKNLLDFNFVLEKLEALDLFVVYLCLFALRDFRDLPAILEPGELRELQDKLFPSSVMVHKDFNELRFMELLLDQFYKIKENIIDKNKYQVTRWADEARSKLAKLSDAELSGYFPNTTPEEIEEFRAGVKRRR